MMVYRGKKYKISVFIRQMLDLTVHNSQTFAYHSIAWSGMQWYAMDSIHFFVLGTKYGIQLI